MFTMMTTKELKANGLNFIVYGRRYDGVLVDLDYTNTRMEAVASKAEFDKHRHTEYPKTWIKKV